MSLLSLDIRELPVRLHLGDNVPLSATLFLHRHGLHGQEGLLDRLNGTDPFLPLRWDGKIQLVARSSIACLQSNESPHDNPDLPDRIAPPQRLRISLRNGTELRGAIQVLMPSNHNRLLDFLNLKERFFALDVDNETTVVNKDWIESVEPLMEET